MKSPIALLTPIAREHLDIPTLETRRGDSLDFYTVTVWGIRNALKEAFDAGSNTASKAAPAMLSALKYALEFLEANDDGEHDVVSRIASVRAAIAKAEAFGIRQPVAAAVQPIVTVTVIAGLIQDVLATMPVHVVVEDWDVPDEDSGKKPARSVWKLDGASPPPIVND